ADASSYGFTVLTAVPEPSSLLLLAGLVCGTGFIRRR
ncbi:MAG: PEP-CTERM sorting domain-containing protein, partial [Planctomycetaceae bacterium]|nr:PEP-CTERM sorting domain-containing protein [Planctomycetaceae bacterium]